MTARVFHADLWGRREDKYGWLEAHDVSNTPWTEQAVAPPFGAQCHVDSGTVSLTVRPSIRRADRSERSGSVY